MTSSDVVKVLSELANGFNPSTGEPLPAESLYNDPTVIRALFAAVWHLQNSQGPTPSTRTSALPENTGRPWSAEEEDRLICAFDAGNSVSELAKTHARTT